MKKYTLKSTGQRIHPLEYTGQGVKPWPPSHERVLIPNQHGQHHIQFVRMDNIKTVALSFDDVA